MRWLMVGLASGAVLAGCNKPIDFDPDLEVDFPGEQSDQVTIEPDGTVRVRIRVCVPGLDSAVARVTDLRRSGDAGAASLAVVLVRVPDDDDDAADDDADDAEDAENDECNRLGAELRLPAPASGPLEIEVAALGARKVKTRQLVHPDSVTFAMMNPIRFAPSAYEPGGDLVRVTVQTIGAAEGTPVGLRAVPSSVQISRATAPVDGSGVATFYLSIPDDVAGVWVEATLGQSRSNATVMNATVMREDP